MRRLLCVLLCLCLLLPAAGCHGSRETGGFAVPEMLDTEGRYQLTFWAKNDTNKTQTEIYDKAVADFEALYPNVKVTLRLYTDYGKIYNDVITNISTGTTPNVCITYRDHIATYLTGENVVAQLDPLFADPRYGLGGSELRFDAPAANELVEQFREEGHFAGHYYALPFMRSTEACYVNKDYVEALGYTLPDILTWDFIWEVSQAAMEKDEGGLFKVNRQNVLIPFIYKSTDNMMIQYLRQTGGGYSDASGHIQLFNDDTRDFLLGIAPYAASGAFSTFKISGYPANFLNAGQCIFAVDSTAGATWMGSDAPLLDISEDRLVRFETAVYPVPQADPAQMSMISQGPSICVFQKEDPQEVLYAWLFAQFLLTDEVQLTYAQTEGYVPVTTRAQESEAYRDYLSRGGEDDLHYPVKLAATRLLLDYVDCTFMTPVFNGSASLRDASGALIEGVAKGARRRQTVDSAFIDQLFADTGSLYRLDQIGTQAASRAAELGPLPVTAVVLLCCIGGAWVLIGGYTLTEYLKKRHKCKQ